MSKTDKNKKISEAMVGNNNAEKWNKEASIKLFEDAIELTNKQEDFIVSGKTVKGYSYDFIGEIARELGTYHEKFNHLLERFPNELETLNKQLRNNIEQNCYSNTKRGIIKEATGIVNLKSNWKWTDRVENENKNTHEINISPIEWVKQK